jgi:stage II sporulation protein AA (anti-sigma F factor antagonist)
MDIDTRTEGSVTVVAIRGKLDAVTAPTFEQHVRATVDAGNHAIVVDLARLDYISSAGLRALLVLAKQVKARGGKACVAGVSGDVRSVFEMSGFGTIFDLVESVPAGIASVSVS